MSWRKDSSMGGAVWDTEPLSTHDVLCRDEEIKWLVDHERQHWGLINGRLVTKGDPEAYGTYAGIAANPPTGTLANVPSLSGEASLWNVALYTPWIATALVAPSAWQLYVSWQTVTVASPASLTINPRVGTFSAGASSVGGIALGADGAITLTASITTDWICTARLTVQSIGIPGANSKAAGSFNVVAKPATTGTGAATINDIFGFTVASFDASIASGVTLGMANTVTTINYTPTQIHWISLF